MLGIKSILLFSLKEIRLPKP